MMKIFKKLILIITLAVLFTCCKKDEVNLISLNSVGEEHYFGEKVLMWASTEGVKENISYEWATTGGRFEGERTQNLFENVWIAPLTVGKYQVSSTAKIGKSKSTKIIEMNVSRYFFDHFQSSNIFAGNGWPGWVLTQSSPAQFNTENKLNSRIELSSLRVNSSNIDSRISKKLDLAELKAPFSIRTKVGYKTYFKPGAPFAISLFFRQPTTNLDRPYMREIRVEIYPTPTSTTSPQYQIRYEAYTPVKNISSFSANNNTYPSALALINPVNGRNNALLTFTDNVAKNITFSLDADNVFIFHVDGIEWFRSDGLKNWLSTAKAQWPDFAIPLANEFRIMMPGQVSTTTQKSTLFLNSVYINNDGTVLSDPL